MIEEAAFGTKPYRLNALTARTPDLPLTSERNPNVEAVGELSIHLQTPRKNSAFGEELN